MAIASPLIHGTESPIALFWMDESHLPNNDCKEYAISSTPLPLHYTSDIMLLRLSFFLLGILFSGGTLIGKPFTVSIDNIDEGVSLSWDDRGIGFAYTIQVSEDLVNWIPPKPWSNWPVSEHTWSDSLLPGKPMRFYRVHAIDRGHLVSASHDSTVSLPSINFLLTALGLQGSVTAKHAVAIYRIEYETIGLFFEPVIATGTLFVPQGLDGPASLLSYQHGTQLLRVDSEEENVGILFASVGFPTLMPDYLGLGGDESSLHPYVHSRSLATAVVDMLRAGRQAVNDLDVSLTEDIFLAGYSEGGLATLAAQREIEQRHSDEFSIAASAPGAGPYDLSGVMLNLIIEQKPYNAPHYLPYVLFAYNQLYHFFDSPDEFLVEPYATTLPPLFNGQHDSGEIDAAMPASKVPAEILRPEVLQAIINNPEHPVRVALRENDLYDWKPIASTHLYHCEADTVVPFSNSEVAFDSFVTNGATDVSIVDPSPTTEHGACGISAMLAAANWFLTQ